MSQSVVSNFFARYKTHLIHLEMEEYVGWITRHWPGWVGYNLRFIVYKILLEEIDSFGYIHPGVYLTHTYGIRIGRSVIIHTGAILDGRGGITLGDYVSIGSNVCITSSTHLYRDHSSPKPLQGHVMKPVLIRDEAVIGEKSTILGGVTIGKSAVVENGSVVTKNVEDYAIVSGIPAKVVGSRVNKIIIKH
jgi:acetyltransferase-like isoleucine patch superfamily enzyme